MTGKEKDYAEAALLLAFEAGRWLGQVDLEEHYDRLQYGMGAIESAYSRKNTMPMNHASISRNVEINLRSHEWREGVKKSVKEYLGKARKLLYENKL